MTKNQDGYYKIVADKIALNGGVGTFFVERLSREEIRKISVKLDKTVFYIYTLGSDRVAIEIKFVKGCGFDSEIELENYIAERAGLCMGVKDDKGLISDIAGYAYDVLPVIFNDEFEITRRFPIIVEKDVFGKTIMSSDGYGMVFGNV